MTDAFYEYYFINKRELFCKQYCAERSPSLLFLSTCVYIFNAVGGARVISERTDRPDGMMTRGVLLNATKS